MQDMVLIVEKVVMFKIDWREVWGGGSKNRSLGRTQMVSVPSHQDDEVLFILSKS